MARDTRLQKFLSEAGIASRRKSEEFIADGRVTVNGRRAKIGDKVDVRKDVVAVDGEKVEFDRNRQSIYIMLHKPRGYVTTMEDEQGRKCVAELVKDVGTRVYPVGRLDYDTEGMLLLTDDGDLAFRLTHPKNEIPKTYLVKIEGSISDNALNQLRAGVELDGKLTNKSKVKVIETDKQYTKLHVTINEGRNRQVRRMLESVGKEVTFLKRIKIGDMGLGSLERGKVRKLTAEEIFYLTNL